MAASRLTSTSVTSLHGVERPAKKAVRGRSGPGAALGLESVMVTLDEQVDALVDRLGGRLAALSNYGYSRDAVMKVAIRRMCHGSPASACPDT